MADLNSERQQRAKHTPPASKTARAILRRQLDEIEKQRPNDDYHGQTDEYRRQIIVEAAVNLAYELIMEGSNGSVEETDYLTSAVMQVFVEKVHTAVVSRLLRKDLADRFATTPTT